LGDKKKMTEEQIKQTSKITEFARNMVKQSNYPEDLQDHIIATCMVVVTEAAKELEKENAELKERNAELRGMYVHSAREAGTYKQFLEAKEKENTELKHDKEVLKDELQFMCGNLSEGLRRQKDQLTKAKELLKQLVDIEYAVNIPKEKIISLRVKAEQFISEVEK
jgi:hypothetical protein